MIPALTQFFGDVKNKDILDIGCGGGQIAKVLTDRGTKLTGIDSSIDMIGIAKKNILK
ncbi:hypothetical protein COV56_02950 [Candidatus Kuenenbacteria bacterium CG11_big_fil_rev_8_21_14_0_20_37_9]|uniref:Methyltransferase domain-containing protein n=1 Tax=Candidatus Kuenenbacteria bacterium CG08_land_8_20_14_0_20_37_23 TaxID=1974617 RepID=A0A2M6XSD3_9BACT|nr:MAG: hypothetical protein COV56_02950 [Candidatus Kuenenbacteria bacterium CG11_big_fil_rev_8_21_14_0_20_37_9]PIU10546.1 MAG: hypothetical protein COT27_02580 [Candidatus Kuenenbacteria bacterium CG08_land_8_20_14_0_20_37_23]